MTDIKKKYKDENILGYLFISPWLLGFFALTIFPIFMSLYLSFTNYDVVSSPFWVGLNNYIQIITDDSEFIQAIKVTFFYVLIAVPLRLGFALLLAVLLAQKRKAVSFYRTVLYIPSLIGGSVAVSVMWRQLFGYKGALNSILMSIGVIDHNVPWIGGPKTAIWTLIILAAWQFGSPMLIFIAGLKQIPVSLYEAALVDGASWWQKFSKITIPMLSPVILFNLVMQTISGFMMFTQAYIITEGGPFNRTMVYILYLFKRAFSFYDMGYASALAWILLFFVAVVTLLIFKTTPHWVHYED